MPSGVYQHKPPSDETRRRLCLARKNSPNHSFRQSPEYKKKVIESRRKNCNGGWWKQDMQSISKLYSKALKKYYLDNPSARERASEKTTKQLLSLNGNSKKLIHYKLGYFWSSKNNCKMYYRSSYELLAMQIFEQLESITKYEYEVLSISYKDEGGILRHTIPDFIVYYSNGTKSIVEIKPQFKITGNIQNTNIKLEAMKNYARDNDYNFSVWAEDGLALRKNVFLNK